MAFTTAKEKKQPDPRLREFMFVDRVSQPDAPGRPGGSGLWYDSSDDPTGGSPTWSGQFVLVAKCGDHKWRLIGLVKVTEVGYLKPSEWLNLEPKVSISTNFHS
jgi:hypothetical protein